MKRVKCVLIGDGGVGKTSLATRFALGEFPDTYMPTTFDSHTAVRKLGAGELVEINIWDCAGQKEFDEVRQYVYHPGLDVFALCFSLVDRRTLQHCEQRWLAEMQDFDPTVPFVLLGTKADLRDRALIQGSSAIAEVILTEEGVRLARRLGAEQYVEVSARTGANVERAFLAAAKAALAQSDDSFVGSDGAWKDTERNDRYELKRRDAARAADSGCCGCGVQ
jgi:small GTP-binding protein